MDRKKRLVGECNNDYDRISNLPEDIICHILSFIPTKFSVRTRVLSKRWKQLFTLVPVLNFFFCTESSDPSTVGRFLDFVSWVFSSYNVNQMDRFCYFYGFDHQNPSPPLHFWISESIRRGVRELNVTQYCSDGALPRSVFTCETLASLKVKGDFILEVPDNVRLPNLKTLHLLDVSFYDACSVERLSRSCPVLEELSFYFDQTMNDKWVLNLSIPTLKTLKIEQDLSYVSFVLDVPNIECFEYIGCYYNCVVSAVHDFKLLDKACFDFQRYGYTADKVDCMASHVRHICFSASTLKAFKSNKCFSPPIFLKVTHLDIKGISSSHFPLVLELLNGTPHLEVLVVDCVLHSTKEGNQLLLKDVPTCVSLHLKEVEIFGFSMLKYQRKLVKYFWKMPKVYAR